MGGRESFLEMKFGPSIEGGVRVFQKRVGGGQRQKWGERGTLGGSLGAWRHLVHRSEVPWGFRAEHQEEEAGVGGMARSQGWAQG